jgi:C1A family cysteine protease
MAKPKVKGASRQNVERICNLIPSRETERDWTMQDALTARAFGAPAALPPQLDLRESWWKINNQGNTGSCVGWASADGVMRYHLVHANRLNRDQLLSVRFVWMASKETDEFRSRPETFIEGAGTSLKAAMDVARKYGCVLETDLHFDIHTLMFVGNENSFYAGAATRRAAAYYNIGKDPASWKAWLAGHGPLLAGVSVDATWDNATDTHGNLDTFKPSTVRGGHAACVVGYTKDRFIIRNSWGKSWGDKGFGYATVSYIKDAFFAESYGVTL